MNFTNTMLFNKNAFEPDFTIDVSHRKTKSQILRDIAIQKKIENVREKSRSRSGLRGPKSSKMLGRKMKSRGKSKRKITPGKKKRRLVMVDGDDPKLRKKSAGSSTHPDVPKLDLENAIFGNLELLRVSKQELRKSLSKSKNRQKRKKKKKRRNPKKRTKSPFIPSCAFSNKMTKSALQRKNENERKIKELERMKKQKEKYAQWDQYTQFKREEPPQDQGLMNDPGLNYSKERERNMMKRKNTPSKINLEKRRDASPNFDSLSYHRKIKVLQEYTPKMKKPGLRKKRKKKTIKRNVTPKIRSRYKTPKPNKSKTPRKKRSRVKKDKRDKSKGYYVIKKEALKSETVEVKKRNRVPIVSPHKKPGKTPERKERNIVKNLTKIQRQIRGRNKYNNLVDSSDAGNLRSSDRNLPQNFNRMLARHESSPKFQLKYDSDFKLDTQRRLLNSESALVGDKKKEINEKSRKMDEVIYHTFSKKDQGNDKPAQPQFQEAKRPRNEARPIKTKVQKKKEKHRLQVRNTHREREEEFDLPERRAAQNNLKYLRSETADFKQIENIDKKRKTRYLDLEFSGRNENELGERVPGISDSNVSIIAEGIEVDPEQYDRPARKLKPVKLLLDGLVNMKPSLFSNRLIFSTVDKVAMNFSPLPLPLIKKEAGGSSSKGLPPLPSGQLNGPFSVIVTSIDPSSTDRKISMNSNEQSKGVIIESNKDKTFSMFYEEEDDDFDPNENISSNFNKSSSQFNKNSMSLRMITSEMMAESSEDFDPNKTSADLTKSKIGRSNTGGSSQISFSGGLDDSEITYNPNLDKQSDTMILEASRDVRNLDNLDLLDKTVSRNTSKTSQGREYFSPKRSLSKEGGSSMASSLMYNSFSFTNDTSVM